MPGFKERYLKKRTARYKSRKSVPKFIKEEAKGQYAYSKAVPGFLIGEAHKAKAAGSPTPLKGGGVAVFGSRIGKRIGKPSKTPQIARAKSKVKVATGAPPKAKRADTTPTVTTPSHPAPIHQAASRASTPSWNPPEFFKPGEVSTSARVAAGLAGGAAAGAAMVVGSKIRKALKARGTVGSTGELAIVKGEIAKPPTRSLVVRPGRAVTVIEKQPPRPERPLSERTPKPRPGGAVARVAAAAKKKTAKKKKTTAKKKKTTAKKKTATKTRTGLAAKLEATKSTKVEVAPKVETKPAPTTKTGAEIAPKVRTTKLRKKGTTKKVTTAAPKTPTTKTTPAPRAATIVPGKGSAGDTMKMTDPATEAEVRSTIQKGKGSATASKPDAARRLPMPDPRRPVQVIASVGDVAKEAEHAAKVQARRDAQRQASRPAEVVKPAAPVMSKPDTKKKVKSAVIKTTAAPKRRINPNAPPEGSVKSPPRPTAAHIAEGRRTIDTRDAAAKASKAKTSAATAAVRASRVGSRAIPLLAGLGIGLAARESYARTSGTSKQKAKAAVRTAKVETNITGKTFGAIAAAGLAAPIATAGIVAGVATAGSIVAAGVAAKEGYKAFSAHRSAQKAQKAMRARYGTVGAATATRHRKRRESVRLAKHKQRTQDWKMLK